MKKTQEVYLIIKRLIDIFGCVVGIPFIFVLVWWWLILINSIVTKGHPFFSHERIGKNGKEFRIIKFRSMKYEVDPNISSESADYNKLVTPFGKFLRKTSLDETPQLLNIFVGHMSFIGPRPLINYGEDKITIEERKENGSIKLRPGLGGYAQVHGRVNVSPEEKGKLDGYYYEHISLWLDIKLFVQTLLHATSGDNTEKKAK